MQPFYEQLIHIPLFIWDPRGGRCGARCSSLVQTIDLAPTLLEFFGVARPADMLGTPLGAAVAADAPVREAALFGIHGGHVNCTDGRYVYMRAPANPDNAPLYNYTLMPTHMRDPFSLDELRGAEMAGPFPFTKGCGLLRTKAEAWNNPYPFGTLLFDLAGDPGQECPLHDPAVEEKMTGLMVDLMKENDAPPEQYIRLGLS